MSREHRMSLTNSESEVQQIKGQEKGANAIKRGEKKKAMEYEKKGKEALKILNKETSLRKAEEKKKYK